MRIKIKRFIITALLLIVSSNVTAAPTCQSLFQPTLTQRLIRGIPNLIIRNAEANPTETRLLGLATRITPKERPTLFSKAGYYAFDYIPEKLGYLITLDRNYTFTPFKAIDEWVFDRPTRAISKGLIGKKKELGLLTKLPLVVLFSTMVWKNIDQHYFWPAAEKQATVQVLEHTTRNANYYDQIIRSDFRFEEIKIKKEEALRQNPESTLPTDFKNLEKDQLNAIIESNPTVKARVLAYGKLQIFESYYRQFDQIENPRLLTATDQQILFGQHPLFQHLNVFLKKEFGQPGASLASQNSRPLSEAQINQMYHLTHLLYFKYKVLDLIFTDQINSDSTTQSQRQMAQDIVRDSYTQELLKIHRSGAITSQQLVYFLQEDAYFAYNLSLFNVLNIVELNPVTNAPFTLNDLRQDRLNSLR